MRQPDRAAPVPDVTPATANWPAVRAAVAVVTATSASTPVAFADLLCGHEPADVVQALAVVSVVILHLAAPGEDGEDLLARIGLAAADLDLAAGAP